MTPVRPLFDFRHASTARFEVAGVVLLFAVLGAGVLLTAPASHVPGTGVTLPSRAMLPAAEGSATGPATSIEAAGAVPTEMVVGAPTAFAWEALDAHGALVLSFAVAAELTVTESGNGSNDPAWVNSTSIGAITRSANGTFAVPSAAWSGGVLNLSVDVGTAVPATVRLFGPSLPSVPVPMALTVLPDRSHLVLYLPGVPLISTHGGVRSNATLWHVHDRFGDPAPGAALAVEYTTQGSVNQTLSPVVWSAGGGTTVAWVNYTTNGAQPGTLTVLDAAGATLLGPISVPANVSAASSGPPSLSPFALAAVALLGLGGVGGVGVLLAGGRPRPSPATTREEEELRRLAEGRATVVELLRRSGPLTLHEIETSWEPPPAPPALADWVASLVTDGTLTATIGEGGRARFSLAERPAAEPRVTLDEEALEQGIARRDAAVAPEESTEDAEGNRDTR